MEKGRILQKSIAVILVLCMTAANFVFAITNTVYALTEAGENITFSAYFKSGDQKTTQKAANISEGSSLFISLKLSAGELKEGKVKIDNANFKLDENVENKYINSINVETNEIELNTINYNDGNEDGIEIEIPVLFEEADEIDTSYFEKENSITLTGKYRNGDNEENYSSEAVYTKLRWTEGLENTESKVTWSYGAGLQKAICLEDKTIVEAFIKMSYTKQYFPKESEKVTVTLPKINNIAPSSYIVLVNGDKIADTEIENTTLAESNETNTDAITFTNKLLNDNKIKWTKTGDIYKVIYVYDGVTELPNNVSIKAKADLKLYNREVKTSDILEISVNEPKGTIASAEAKGTSKEIYKGYMYANSINETTFEELYKLEMSNVDGVTAEYEFEKSKFLNEEEEKSTNDKVYYKEIKINKDSLEKVIGTNGKLEVTVYDKDENEKTTEIVINETTVVDEDGNIAVDFDNIQEPVKAKISVIGAESEGTIKVTATKAVKGNAGYDRDTLKTVNKIATEVISKNNKQEATSKSVAKTELKEPKNTAELTMNHNNILSTSEVNNIEFIAKLNVGTIDTDLLNNPKLEITLPKEVEDVDIKASEIQIMHDDNKLSVQGIEKEVSGEGYKVIIKLAGEQEEYTNELTQGVNVVIPAKITLKATSLSRDDATIQLLYKNQDDTESFTTSIENVRIQSHYGIVTSSGLQTIFETESKAKQTLAVAFVNNYGDAVENLSIIGQVPAVDLSQEEFEQTIRESFIIGDSNANATNKVDKMVIKYSQDKETWSDSKENANYYKIQMTGDNYKDVLDISEQVIVKFSIDTNITMPAYWFEYEVNGIENEETLTINRSSEERPEPEQPGQDEIQTEEQEETTEAKALTVKMVAKSGSGEVKDGDEVKEGQVIRYTYTIKNNSDKDITNVKLVANHENANVFEDVTEQQENTAKPDEMINFTSEKELEKSNTEYKVGIIKAGKTKTVTYQIRVRGDVQNVNTNVNISADETEAKIFNLNNNVVEAKLKVSMKNNTSKEYPVVLGNIVANTITVKNISDEALSNIVVSATIPEEFKFFELWDKQNSNNFEIIHKSDNQIEFMIKDLSAGASKEMVLSLIKDKETERKSIQMSCTAKLNTDIYYSNDTYIGLKEKTVSKIEAKQTSNVENETVKTGDKITYKISLKNTGDIKDTFTIQDVVPNGAVIKKLYYVIDNEKFESFDYISNIVVFMISLDKDKEVSLYIQTEIDEALTLEKEITNYATIEGNNLENIETTNKITYKLETDMQKQEENKDEDNKQEENNNEDENKQDEENNNKSDKDNKDDNKDDNKTDDKSTVVSKHNISGLAWVDENKNGIREEKEKLLSGIKVTLANTETGKFVTDSEGNRLETTTNDEGEYKFEKIVDGKYIVIFTYDNTKYRHTEYRVKGATEKTNSDIITSKLSKTNDEIKYAITDTLELNGKSLENVDAGFIENELFDLNINKYITKITLQNTSGTVVKQYSKEKLAKVEIDSKNLAGTKVLIEYTMQITNDGEIAGYANEIVDYLPKDLTFESSKNKKWYLSTDGYLHTNVLSKELINPGETKEVKLVLIKTMTDSNVGLTSNEAEIVNYSNDLSIPDKDKINASTAEMIISIRTGVGVTIGIIITLIAITATGIIVYTKKRKEAIHE